MDKRVFPEDVQVPEKWKDRNFFHYEEFGAMLGVDCQTVSYWVRKGYLKAREFSPRYKLIPLSELYRYMKGEMMGVANDNA